MRTNELKGKRIINVSNRLPVKISFTNGKMVYTTSEGGLATGLSSVFGAYENLWIGWAGAEVHENEKAAIREDLNDMNLHPVFLNKTEIANYYEGFSNETIWPLFHYFPTSCVYDLKYWETYKSVNQKFANEVLKHATADDIVWVNDYQLMLVPQMLREALPGITIGYFQHIPFPSYEIFRSLPWRAEVLKGLLGADTVGFQTAEDNENFLAATASILGVNRTENEILLNDRVVRADAFPISIDYNKYKDLAKEDATIVAAKKIQKRINTKLAVSVDRLDYSKGIIQRLKAFAHFLDKHPEWLEKVTLFHLVVPSRDTVKNYKELKEEMNKVVSEINGKYATLDWQPIHHHYRSMPPNTLSALYKSADLALVTPLRDGMNLVSKEYVASKTDGNGVLLLSETAGAARELTDALILNPNDIEEYAARIYEGLMMPLKEKKARMANMQQLIQNADIFNWASRFLKAITDTVNEHPVNVCEPVNAAVLEQIDSRYAYAQKRLILLDYDGTIVPFFKKTEDACPDKALLQLLENMASDKRNNIVIISGRDSATLTKWLGHLPIEIIAEHGAQYRERNKKWFSHPGLKTDWKKAVTNTFASYTMAVPGSFIEEKSYSIAWHYRAAEKSVGEDTVKKVIYELRSKINTTTVDIMEGSKVIEVKSNVVNKGKAAMQLVDKGDYDFIMAIGDDTTDEDMFKALPKDTITIKVGSNISAATYCQASFIEVRSLLQEMHKSASTVFSN
ncbi:MAG: bifunctional alpha,alpha-trehalose-phosphate synthase (UDP-forming)/trehalose-phosphatase [Bacteroidota bacterium]